MGTGKRDSAAYRRGAQRTWLGAQSFRRSRSCAIPAPPSTPGTVRSIAPPTQRKAEAGDRHGSARVDHKPSARRSRACSNPPVTSRRCLCARIRSMPLQSVDRWCVDYKRCATRTILLLSRPGRRSSPSTERHLLRPKHAGSRGDQLSVIDRDAAAIESAHVQNPRGVSGGMIRRAISIVIGSRRQAVRAASVGRSATPTTTRDFVSRHHGDHRSQNLPRRAPEFV